MANRYLKSRQFAFEQDTVSIYTRFKVGATGAVTAGTVKGGGVTSIVRNSAGDYTITLSDGWTQLLAFNCFLLFTGATGNATFELKFATPDTFQSNFQTNRTIEFLTVNGAGAAADPPNGSYLYIQVVVRMSSISPFGFN